MPEGVLGFGWYFSKVRMNPWDFGDVSVLGVELWNTLDGGETWERMGPEWWTYEVHADKHDLQWLGPNELILATDGGAYRTTDHGETWQDIEALPIGQFYHVTHIPWAPGWYTAGAQDNGTSTGNVSVAANWTRDRGGDSYALYHPNDSNLRVATVQYANFAYSLTSWDVNGLTDFTEGIDSEDRQPWDAPIMFHPAIPDIAWCATERVFRMEGAPFGIWEPVSDDLTLAVSPGLSFRVVTSLSGSPFNPDWVAAGTSDGQVWFTTNGGGDWNLMVGDLPQRQVTDIAFDPFHADSITVTLNGYKDAVYTPHVFRASLGGTWQDVTGDLPDHPANDWRALNDSTWVLATDFGVYHTTNWGQHWGVWATCLTSPCLSWMWTLPLLNWWRRRVREAFRRFLLTASCRNPRSLSRWTPTSLPWVTSSRLGLLASGFWDILLRTVEGHNWIPPGRAQRGRCTT